MTKKLDYEGQNPGSGEPKPASVAGFVPRAHSRQLEKDVNPGLDSTPSAIAGLEPEPAAAALVFGDKLAKIREFTNLLANYGEERGLIGPLELARLWTRHIVNSGLVAQLLKPGLVGDIGSGAGLPGLVLAIARPDVQLILIEPMERRTDWLREVTVTMRLDNVTVVRARAEDYHPVPKLDQVTARAVSALKKLLPISAPLLKPGGELILMKGNSVAAEISGATKELRKYRISEAEVLLLGEEFDTEVTRVFRATVAAND